MKISLQAERIHFTLWIPASLLLNTPLMRPLLRSQDIHISRDQVHALCQGIKRLCKEHPSMPLFEVTGTDFRIRIHP